MIKSSHGYRNMLQSINLISHEAATQNRKSQIPLDWQNEMTRNELRIIGPAIKAIRTRRKYSWQTLKREIWDYGYQSFYPTQMDFLPNIEKAVQGLTPDVRSSLLNEWNNAYPKRPELTESNFNATYSLYILEEIVERARVAAYRTTNW